MSYRRVVTITVAFVAVLILVACLIQSSLHGLLFLIPLVAAWIALDGLNLVADARHFALRSRSDYRVEREFRRQLRAGRTA